MDNSHVALVAVELKEAAFMQFRCDRPMPLGINLGSLSKVIKCAKDDDTVTLRAGDDQDMLHLTYEAKSKNPSISSPVQPPHYNATDTDRIAEYDMKLMDIDQDELGIPETDYDATVTMSSGEFSRIVRDLGTLGESVKIEVNKEGVRFVAEGESANGSVLLKQAGGGKIERVGAGSSEKKSKVKKEEDIEVDDDEEDDEEERPKKKSKTKVKKEKKDKDDDDDANMSEDDGGSPKEDGEDEKGDTEDEDDDDEEGGSSKKRKRPSKANGKKKSKKEKKGKGRKDDSDDEFDESGAVIHMNQHVTLTFSLKYLMNFAKSQSLSKKVELMMSNEVPLLVSTTRSLRRTL